MPERGQIRIGIGGWTFEPWRGVFYPDDLKQKDELRYASSKLTAIEINGTYYGAQKPQTWRKWASEVPDGFVFSVKGSRFTTQRRVLAEAGESLDKFMDQGLLELGDKLGPILWQLPNTKKFDEADLGAFLELLPYEIDGRRIRHCIEARHDSFRTPAFPALLRRFGVPVVFAEHQTYPAFADVVGDFVYARLQTGSDEIETAYSDKDLDLWAGRLKTWAEGGRPEGLDCADPHHSAEKRPRDVFAYIIHEGKVRAPAGAMALIERCKGP
ncbi:DUF72 domain-containing protein [Phenylobacterium montanum]|uniref:DUF72 domain-containing protein n=1 Tax=Phenylobacterium montanum TaxID=2823693 RepID=A0A975FYK3_9CAUL|nr:DUF72 domain-containing protein [Caulobacter sp. S6]QUD87354.1 DUF72 domain-containing protein [Caulobacter sp. S6]